MEIMSLKCVLQHVRMEILLIHVRIHAITSALVRTVCLIRLIVNVLTLSVFMVEIVKNAFIHVFIVIQN
jgi:hypothetical protein